MVPVSNGESISTASPGVAQESAAIHFEFFLLSTQRPQNADGYPHVAVVIHRIMHSSSTGSLT